MERTLFRKHERTGPLFGENTFIEKLERLSGRKLKPPTPGTKVKDK